MEGDETMVNKSWKLIWSDEFDKDDIDTEVWNHELGYIRNNELQWYTDDKKNAYIENGNLVLEAVKEENSDVKYTSASINTKGKRSWKYGKFEMKAKLPYGKGIWPAFWSMGDNGPWPVCGEIDIMEMIGGGAADSTVYGTLHWDADGEHKQLGSTYSLSNGKFSDDYHIFSIEWDENEIKWFVDDNLYHSIKLDGDRESKFQQPHYILLNLAVGGNWPGSPNENTVFPQKYYIDYVRVYQK